MKKSSAKHIQTALKKTNNKRQSYSNFTNLRQPTKSRVAKITKSESVKKINWKCWLNNTKLTVFLLYEKSVKKINKIIKKKENNKSGFNNVGKL